MAIIKYDFGEVLNRVLHEKRFGMVTRNGKTFKRNYHRELKNGKGLNLTQAAYEEFASIKFTSLFDKE